MGRDSGSLQCGLWTSRAFGWENREHRVSCLPQWLVFYLPSTLKCCNVTFLCARSQRDKILMFVAFSPVPFVINSIYFWCSLIYLLARTSAMFFIASSINDESRKPLKILRTIPSEGWFSEAQRFSHQVQSECIAMSGKKFFFITRGIIISIAGTIVTYELVLLQFNGNAIVSDMFHPCPVPPIEGQ